MQRLEDIRDENQMADLSFHAYRDLFRTDPEPFLIAALERNPVSLEGSGTDCDEDIHAAIQAMDGDSIYDEKGRLAQPDEVWNYGRGDGVEKAVLLGNILRHRHPGEEIRIEIQPDRVVLKTSKGKMEFPSKKGLNEAVWALAPG